MSDETKRPFLPYNTKHRQRARDLRTNATRAERRLWYEFLRKHTLVWHRQKPLDNYIADFYCSIARLVIEIDGDSHYVPDAAEYDTNRTHILEGLGLRVIRFTNTDVLCNIEGVCRKIEEVLQEQLHILTQSS